MFEKIKHITLKEVGLIVLALLLFYPFTLLLQAFLGSADDSIWLHLKQTVLADYIYNSLLLIFYVAILCFFLGFLPAWYLSNYTFRGARFLSWALILPLTIPSYIMAYAYVGFFDLTGILSTVLRWFGIDGFHLDVIQTSVLGLVLAFSLFPYLFIISKAYFESATRRYVQAAKTLGLNSFEIFFKVILPLSRPALVAGLSLVIMELLNDYGAVKYFGVPTFTTGIFKVWFAYGDHQAALKLAFYLLIIALVILFIERRSRQQMKFTDTASQSQVLQKEKLPASKKWIIIWCWFPFVLAFVLPLIQLIFWALNALDYIDYSFFVLIWDSFLTASVAALFVLLIALFVNYVARFSRQVFLKKLSNYLTLGYAIPGAIIAVCVLLPFTKWSINFNNFFDLKWGLFLNQLGFTLVFAYLMRFFAVGYNGIEASMQSISATIDDSAKLFGFKALKTMIKIILPNLKPAIVASFLMLFIDLLKELPLTLILRPFNFDTLATKTFELAGDEMLEESAWSALIIVGLGCTVSFFLKKVIKL